jgi:hypothetical protein
VSLVRNDVSEKRITSIIGGERVSELEATLAVFLHSMLQFLVTANVASSSLILSTLMMEVIRSSESSVLAGATRRLIPEDGILHNHRRENLKSGKVELSVRLRLDVFIHVWLTWAPIADEWSASRPYRFTAGEITPGTHWLRGWMGPRAGLDFVEKRGSLAFLGLELLVRGRYTD